MLLDGDHLLLGDEAMPGAERLGVEGGVRVIGGHVGAHDAGGVTGNVETGMEAVLQPHTGDGFGADAVPGAVFAGDQLVQFGGAVIFV